MIGGVGACLTRTGRIQDNPIFENPVQLCKTEHAEVAELADALDSGSSARKGVRVQIPASAPPHNRLSYQGFHRFKPSFMRSASALRSFVFGEILT